MVATLDQEKCSDPPVLIRRRLRILVRFLKPVAKNLGKQLVKDFKDDMRSKRREPKDVKLSDDGKTLSIDVDTDDKALFPILYNCRGGDAHSNDAEDDLKHDVDDALHDCEKDLPADEKWDITVDKNPDSRIGGAWMRAASRAARIFCCF